MKLPKGTRRATVGRPKKNPPPDEPIPLTVNQVIDLYGVAAICENIVDGMSFAQIAKKIGVTKSELSLWKYADEERATLLQAAQDESGEIWDRAAEAELRAAGDPFELQKARELAHHFRWRAKMISRSYMERKQVEHQVNEVIPPKRTPEERAEEIRKMHRDHPELKHLIN